LIKLLTGTGRNSVVIKIKPKKKRARDVNKEEIISRHIVISIRLYFIFMI